MDALRLRLAAALVVSSALVAPALAGRKDVHEMARYRTRLLPIAAASCAIGRRTKFME